MQNGCICCTLRMDLLKEIKRLADQGQFDYVVVESTGIAEPMNVAETFELDPETLSTADDELKTLAASACLDTCVTVVDLSMMKYNASSIENVRSAYNEGEGEEGEKPIGQLLMDQLEFANVIILNKADVVSQSEIEFAKTFVANMNPHAKILCTSHSKVNLKEILNTGLFSMEEARASAGWLTELQSGATVKSEIDEYGVVSFVYKARRPFHPARLERWLRRFFVLSDETESLSVNKTEDLQKLSDERSADMQKDMGWIARSKGFVWLATRPGAMTEWNHGGRLLELSPMMQWYVDQPESAWNLDEDGVAKVRTDFSGAWGDKRQEVVFIGIGMKEDVITKSLDECLLTDGEFADHQSAWSRLHDPLPPWPIEEGKWAKAMVAGTNVKLNIPDNLILELDHLSLEMSDPDASAVCRVYLRNDVQENLICTLRAQSCEQFLTRLRIHGPSHEIRVEVSPHGGAQEGVVVHLFGYGQLLEMEEEGEDSHDHEH